MATKPLNPRETFARRLRTERLRAGLSQRELGRRIGLSEDVVSSRVTRYEKGTSEPDFETARRLADALEVPMAYLLADTDTLAEIVRSVAKLSPTKQRALLAEISGRSPSV